jgi:hypothetical protein
LKLWDLEKPQILNGLALESQLMKPPVKILNQIRLLAKFKIGLEDFVSIVRRELNEPHMNFLSFLLDLFV